MTGASRHRGDRDDLVDGSQMLCQVVSAARSLSLRLWKCEAGKVGVSVRLRTAGSGALAVDSEESFEDAVNDFPPMWKPDVPL